MRSVPVLVIALCLWATSALAQAADPIADSMHGYYRGERLSGLFMLGHGSASLGLSGYALSRRSSNDFLAGLGWTLMPLGTLELLGGAFYAEQVGDEISHSGSLLAEDPARFREEELTRIRGRVARFFYYRLFEAVVTGAGVGLLSLGMVSANETVKGVGVGLMIFGAPLLIMDSINTVRASRYVDQLDAYEPTVSLQLGANQVGAVLTLRWH